MVGLHHSKTVVCSAYSKKLELYKKIFQSRSHFLIQVYKNLSRHQLIKKISIEAYLITNFENIVVC